MCLFILRVCFLASPGMCVHHHHRSVLASVVNRNFHHQESLSRQKSSQRFTIIGALKRNRKDTLFGCNTCSSRFQLSVFPSVHRRFPSDCISSSFVFRSENHSWSSISIRTSVQVQYVMFFSRALLEQCLLSDVLLMVMTVIYLVCGLGLSCSALLLLLLSLRVLVSIVQCLCDFTLSHRCLLWREGF